MERKKGTRLFHHLKKWLELAIMDYAMVEEGDRVLVGVSGGADSLALLDLLNSPMVYVPSFSILAVNIDLGFDPEYRDYAVLEEYLRKNQYSYVMEKTDTGPLSHSDYNRKNPCYLCTRLRRKRIFEIAAERGCNKIAFAHHRDDIIETLLVNLFLRKGNLYHDAETVDIRREAPHNSSPCLYRRGTGKEVREGTGLAGCRKQVSYE